MKRKFFSAVIIVVATFLIYIFGKGAYYYVKYAVPDKDYFGTQYKEVLYPMSFEDIRQANEIMELWN